MSDLFEKVATLDIKPHAITRDFYVDWENQFGGDILSPEEAGKLEISPTEMRWVVYSALTHQLREGREAETIDSGAVLLALQGDGFCPALETYVEEYAEPVFQELKTANLKL